jgi:TRAP-type C4-dicarboxylate transport system substrate-binding protein
MGMVATNNLTPFAPSLGFLALPYMFPNEEGIKKLFRAPLMDKIAERAGLESNVRPLSFFIGGYRLLANNRKEVKKTSDLRGLRIRVPRNQLMIEAFRAWDIEPIPLPWTEVWPALESGTIQGQENPINIIFDGVNRTQEVWDELKYITNLHYFLFTAPHMISESFYRQLSDKNRILVEQAASEAEVYSWQLIKNEDKKITEYAKSKGMVFVDPLNEEQDWQKKARSIWPELYFRAGGKELVDNVLDVMNDK